MAERCKNCKHFNFYGSPLLFQYGFCSVQGYEVEAEDIICDDFDDNDTEL